jgi:GNAT superfamily N-acetyltransferase
MYTLRPVIETDLELICRHRYDMFASAGHAQEVLAPMTGAFRAWLRPRLVTRDYFGWIAMLDDHSPAGGIGMMVIDWPPHPAHPLQSARGYILNLFVKAEHRGQEIASTLMARATQEAESRGLDYLVLHATAMGRPLYENLGWQQTAEMSITVKKTAPA